ncbi:MAG: PHP domain-containing protein, partial [Candidatus Hadarchaeales archaeon]
LRKAKEAGLSAVGICDHDSVKGIEEAVKLEEKYGVEVIPGIEMSTELHNQEIHILGYFFNWRDPGFKALLKTIQEVRLWRAELIVTKLQGLGFNLEFDEVRKEASSESIGRPHIARLMVKKKYVETADEAFEKYLRAGAPAYVGKYEMLPEDAVRKIREMQGIPVLAHPKFSVMPEDEFERLVRLGLMGVEVYHSRHSPEESEQYLKLARKYGLLVTGGSDSHGEEDPIGCVRVPYSHVAELKKAKLSLLG